MFDFDQEALMPPFIKRLANIQENGRAILLIVQCFVYYIRETVALLNSRMRLSETELVLRYPLLEVCIIVNPFEQEFFQDFRYYG